MAGFRYALGVLILLVTASMFAVGTANKHITKGTQHWSYGFNYTDWASKHLNTSADSKRIVVGGSEKWHYGFNYSDWAIKNAPFYLNDTLVFKFDPPNGGPTSFPHSVYLLPNFWSFLNCDLRRAKRVASPTQGGGEGFEFVLKKWQPHYFACGERDGLHCKNGTMKFAVFPFIRRWHV
ncbi:uncharacterized protein LOC132285900 [Cornus florida]|uniref:uncharacterized protein LOC132285900 n=1 Tax=Cornus florida TaxID=4283 RepID=UPI00289CC65E|nr:uncharacterized protein LOC132285900 [Cornus florida]